MRRTYMCRVRSHCKPFDTKLSFKQSVHSLIVKPEQVYECSTQEKVTFPQHSVTVKWPTLCTFGRRPKLCGGYAVAVTWPKLG